MVESGRATTVRRWSLLLQVVRCLPWHAKGAKIRSAISRDTAAEMAVSAANSRQLRNGFLSKYLKKQNSAIVC